MLKEKLREKWKKVIAIESELKLDIEIKDGDESGNESNKDIESKVEMEKEWEAA